MVLFWTELMLMFWIFMKKALVKKKVPINYFDKQEKPWIFFFLRHSNSLLFCPVISMNIPDQLILKKVFSELNFQKTKLAVCSSCKLLPHPPYIYSIFSIYIYNIYNIDIYIHIYLYFTFIYLYILYILHVYIYIYVYI